MSATLFIFYSLDQNRRRRSQTLATMISMEQAETPTSSKVIGWLPLVALPSAALVFYNLLVPWAFMWILAISIYAGLKWLTWWNARNHIHHEVWRAIAYLLAWPGMDAEAFLNSHERASRPRFGEWLRAIFVTCAGAALLWIASRVPAPQFLLLRGWIGMLGLILLLHSNRLVVLAELGYCCAPHYVRSSTLAFT
jgi:hypothetical protein